MRLVLIALALALVGCSGTDPTEASTGYAGPAAPPASDPDTREGALAYAEHFVATYNYARRTGDLNGLLPLEDSECWTCQSLRHDLAGVYDNGGRIEGGEWTLLAPQGKQTKSGWIVTSPLQVDPTRVLSGTESPDDSPGTTTRITIEITRISGAWKVLACDKEV